MPEDLEGTNEIMTYIMQIFNFVAVNIDSCEAPLCAITSERTAPVEISLRYLYFVSKHSAPSTMGKQTTTKQKLKTATASIVMLTYAI